jgi:predicted  nucleic acid-binding Zn-ribbon protein
MKDQQRILNLEMALREAKRQIAAREKTIVELGKELEAQNDQAWELVSKAIKLLEGFGR